MTTHTHPNPDALTFACPACRQKVRDDQAALDALTLDLTDAPTLDQPSLFDGPAS